MPSSYQAPMAKDKVKQSSSSQSQMSNLQAQTATVGQLLKTKTAKIITIQPDDALGRAVEVLRDHGIGALIVTDSSGGLCGILSERDIVRKLADTPGQTLPQRVDAIMTANVETCSPDEPLVSVLKRMTTGRFRHMPVLQGSDILGMVTIGDVVNYRLTEVEHEALQLKQLIVG